MTKAECRIYYILNRGNVNLVLYLEWKNVFFTLLSLLLTLFDIRASDKPLQPMTMKDEKKTLTNDNQKETTGTWPFRKKRGCHTVSQRKEAIFPSCPITGHIQVAKTTIYRLPFRRGECVCMIPIRKTLLVKLVVQVPGTCCFGRCVPRQQGKVVSRFPGRQNGRRCQTVRPSAESFVHSLSSSDSWVGRLVRATTVSQVEEFHFLTRAQGTVSSIWRIRTLVELYMLGW